MIDVRLCKWVVIIRSIKFACLVYSHISTSIATTTSVNETFCHSIAKCKKVNFEDMNLACCSRNYAEQVK